MEYIIREILEEEYGLLEPFLYEAIFVPEGMAAPPESIIKQPELQVYLTDFGKKKDDIGLVAEVGTKVVGAVWVRIMNDYGHINDTTPSVAISLYKEYRGRGTVSYTHLDVYKRQVGRRVRRKIKKGILNSYGFWRDIIVGIL